MKQNDELFRPEAKCSKCKERPGVSFISGAGDWCYILCEHCLIEFEQHQLEFFK